MKIFCSRYLGKKGTGASNRAMLTVSIVGSAPVKDPLNMPKEGWPLIDRHIYGLLLIATGMLIMNGLFRRAKV